MQNFLLSVSIIERGIGEGGGEVSGGGGSLTGVWVKISVLGMAVDNSPFAVPQLMQNAASRGISSPQLVQIAISNSST
jgi:hypothetical protein